MPGENENLFSQIQKLYTMQVLCIHQTPVGS